MTLPPVGHDAVRVELERGLPPVALLLGPASVGKRTMADYLLGHHRVVAADVLRVDPLTAEAARGVRAFVGTAPFGSLKVAVLTLDGARDQALQVLLKTLEEPPPAARFLLRATRRPLATIASRAVTYRFGLLSTDQVTQVMHRCGLAGDSAAWAAGMSGGRVTPGLQAAQLEPDSGPVYQVLKAMSVGDPDLLHAAMDKWGDTTHELLVRWAIEAHTRRWRLFSPGDSFGLQTTNVPMQVLLRLSGSPQARPWVAAQAALAPLCQTQ